MAPYVDVIRGIDLAPGMVTQYNKRALEASITQDTMFAHQGDLVAPTDAISTADLHGFDLAITSMALHHFSDPEGTVSALVSRLKPGGTVAVIDWAPTKGGMPWDKKGGEGHEVRHTVSDDASEVLSWESVLPMLGRAGCDLSTAYYVVIGEKAYMPEEAVKIPGGVRLNAFLGFARKKME